MLCDSELIQRQLFINLIALFLQYAFSLFYFYVSSAPLFVLQTLANTLCEKLGKDNLKLRSKVLSLCYSHDGKASSENWSLVVASNKKRSQVSSFDAVIMTVCTQFLFLFIIVMYLPVLLLKLLV